MTLMKNRFGCLLVTAVLLGALVPTSSSATSSRKTFGTIPSVIEAQEAWNKGRTQTAIRHALRVVRESSRSADLEIAYHILCAASAARSDFDTALSYCDRVVSLTREQNWRHLNNRANVLLRAGRVDAALADYDAALAVLASDDAKAAAEDRMASSELVQGNLLVAQQMRAEQTRSIASTSNPNPSAAAVSNDTFSGEAPPAKLASE
jgi:tetratricopeptide (TPR) repeat protein